MKRHFELVAFLILPVILSVVAGCSVSRPEFEPTAASSWNAISTGRLKESLVVYESKAQEAEREANRSAFPRPSWETAALNYYYASRAALNSGDLQKAIIYGERALQTAEKTEEPLYMLTAVQQLIRAYEAVRIFEKSDVLLQRGFELVKQLPQNSGVRDSWEGVLNDESGRAFMRKKEYAKAIDSYLVAIYYYRSWMTGLRANNTSVAIARADIINVMGELGTAYRLTGQLEQAMEQYRQAFGSIKEWGLRYPYENSLYAGMGEIYIQQKRFPEALESFQKALAIAEAQRRPAVIKSASARIAYILRQTGKPEEAKGYDRLAAEQEKSIRSLLISPEDR